MRFVVQKHAARRLHYDFRLEVDGTLRSWAIPKGPSLNPRDRRLAVPVEDHSLGYIDFEGRIAEGQYGAGEVIVWDTGEFENLSQADDRPLSLSRALQRGRAPFRLYGRKLRGDWALTRFRTSRETNWLLMKLNDEYADACADITDERPESVLTGRTVEAMVGRQGR
jgi:DNA ligase D-like protein (predicted 3'-phosphoesterase)